jgi:hypothetical protein
MARVHVSIAWLREERRNMNKLLQEKVSSLGILSKEIDEINGWVNYKKLPLL